MIKFEDTYRHKGLRNQLTAMIREKGIKDERVLDAINSVPRHLFIDSSFLEYAYQDKPFPIGEGQTISQPYTVAFQTELLDIAIGDKVLEVGTGSGYQASVLVEMGAKVYTIERQKALYRRTKVLFSKLGYKPKVFSFGDGYKGLPADAPFDKIIVTAGAPYIPSPLIDQLKPGGKMVIPVGVETQIMKLIEKDFKGNLQETNMGDFRFVPLINSRTK